MHKPNLKDRALVRMLLILDRKQLKNFREYLSCGFFNTNATLLTLLDGLQSKVLKSKKHHISQDEFFQKIKISESMADKLFSQLLAHLNRFVALWDKRNDLLEPMPATLNAWYKMQLEPELLEREYRKMKRKMDQEPASVQDIYHALRLEHRYSEFQTDKPRKDQAAIFEVHNSLLDTYYIVSKLKYTCASLSAGKVFQREQEILPMELSEQVIAALPAIGQAYYQAYLLLSTPTPDYDAAQCLYAYLGSKGQGFLPEERGDLYSFLLNSCFRSLSLGNPAFQNLFSDTYEALLDQGLLNLAGNMQGGHFKNIVSIRVRLGKTDAARAFISEYQHYLEEAERDVLVTYCKGLVDFREGDFPAAISCFRKVVQDSAEDLFWSLEARNMLWKSYFEVYDTLTISEHEEMQRLYHSFRLFVARNSRISDYHKTCYANFIRVFNQLIRVGDKSLWASTAPELQALHLEVAEMNEIVHKKWILDAIASRIEKIS